MSPLFGRRRKTCPRGQVLGAAPGISGQGPGGGAERSSLRRDERSAGSLISDRQWEVLYSHALSRLAQIKEVHGACKRGDSQEVKRISDEFDEDRHLLLILSGSGEELEEAFAAPAPDLRRALARLRTDAEAELKSADATAGERAWLTVRACRSILGSSS